MFGGGGSQPGSLSEAGLGSDFAPLDWGAVKLLRACRTRILAVTRLPETHRTAALCHRRELPDDVHAVAFDPVQGLVMAGHEDGRGTVWAFDPSDEKPKLVEIASLPSRWDARYFGVTRAAIAPSWLVMGSSDKTAVIWTNGKEEGDFEPVLQIRTHEGEVECLAFDGRGEALIVGDTAGAGIWLIEDAVQSPRAWSDPHVNLRDDALYLDVLSAAFSSDNRYVITGYSVMEVRIWEIGLDPVRPTGRLVPLQMAHPAKPIEDHLDHWVGPVALSSDLNWAISACANHTVIWWRLDLDAPQPSAVAALTLETEHVLAIADFAPSSSESRIGWHDASAMRLEYWNCDGAPTPQLARRRTVDFPGLREDEHIAALPASEEWALSHGWSSVGLWRIG